MIGYFDYTVILTYLSAACAVCGICLAAAGDPKTALILLLVCGLLDMLDGPVARHQKDRTNERVRYGIQIDSLSDLTAFGVFPAALCFRLCEESLFSMIAGALFAVAALVRLAWFNVTEEDRVASTTERRKTFTGLPVTSVALLFPLFSAFRAGMGQAAYSVCAPLLLLLISVLFLIRFTLPKPGKREMLLMGIAGIGALLLILFLFA